MRSFLNLLI